MRKLAGLLAVVIVSAAVASTPGAGVSTTSAHPGSPHKALLVDRWYQTLNLGGVAFITLNTYNGFNCGTTCTSNWMAARNNAVNAWNATSTTAWFSDSATLDEANDVRVTVVTNSNGRCASHYDVIYCMSSGLLGIHYTIAHGSASSPPTHSDCNPVADCYPFGTQETSIRHEVILLNDSAHTGPFATLFQRQATAAHELGHVLGLAHDGIGDGYCGNDPAGPYLATVMDYDCLNLGLVNSPTAWDQCGVNHAYYDPRWGYSGC